MPPSGNGASSFHLHWQMPVMREPIVAVAATLEVVEPPVVCATVWLVTDVELAP